MYSDKNLSEYACATRVGTKLTVELINDKLKQRLTAARIAGRLTAVCGRHSAETDRRPGRPNELEEEQELAVCLDGRLGPTRMGCTRFWSVWMGVGEGMS